MLRLWMNCSFWINLLGDWYFLFTEMPPSIAAQRYEQLVCRSVKRVALWIVSSCFFCFFYNVVNEYTLQWTSFFWVWTRSWDLLIHEKNDQTGTSLSWTSWMNWYISRSWAKWMRVYRVSRPLCHLRMQSAVMYCAHTLFYIFIFSIQNTTTCLIPNLWMCKCLSKQLKC